MRRTFVLVGSLLVCCVPSCSERGVPHDAAETPPVSDTDDAGAASSDASASAVDDSPPIIELGEVSVDSDVKFTIPPGTLGFQITAEGKFDPAHPFGIETIIDPHGKVVHDSFAPENNGLRTSDATIDSIAIANVPMGDDVSDDLTGKWTVRFGVVNTPLGASNLKLKGRVRIQSSGDGVFHGGRLDLHVHVPDGLKLGTHAVDASNAASDPELAKRVDTMFAWVDKLLQIDRGTVTFDVADSRFKTISSDLELVSALAISEGEVDGTRALHILLTEQCDAYVDGRVGGNIPGAANVFGRPASGVIAVMTANADVDARTMLHESGHFLGLEHTTDVSHAPGLTASNAGQFFDSLADTPECIGLDFETMTPELLQACPDVDNLMFTIGQPTGFPTPVLSPAQKRVIRGSTVYKAYGPEGRP